MKKFIFKFRGYIPIPFFLLLFIFSSPKIISIIPGTIFILIGECIRLWSIAYSGKRTRCGKPTAEKLIISGPYKYVRNPIYIGNFFSGLGLTTMLWVWIPWTIFIYIIGFFLEYGTIISFEEQFLEEKFGEEYKSYKSHIPSFVPNFSRHLTNRIKGDIKGTLRSERDTFLVIGLFWLAIILKSLLKFV
jgi:protein-S-isoprenylcysteine O-methyltransferase Ste14